MTDRTEPRDPEIVWREVVRGQIAKWNIAVGSHTAHDLTMDPPSYHQEPEQFGPPIPRG